MKSFVFCLVSFVLAVAANARQGSSRRPDGNRSDRTATSQASQTSKASASSADAAGGRSIEFADSATVSDYLMVYAELVGKTVLQDPQLPKVSFGLHPRKNQTLTVEDKIKAIETVLEMNGVHLEEYDEKFVRALPRKDVRKDGIPLIMDPRAEDLKESMRVVSVMIKFEHIAIDEAQKALEGFKSNSGILLVFERTNSILATDTSQIIKRMLEIRESIDKPSSVTEIVEYIQIKYANANEVKQVIDNIVQESMKEQEKNGKQPQKASSVSQPQSPEMSFRERMYGKKQAAPTVAPANNASLVMPVSDADRGMIRGKVVTIADERSNKILIITNAQNMKFFKEVIAALDVATTPDVQVKVYRLKYAEAEDVSDMINDLIGNSASSKDSKGNQNPNAAQGASGSVTRGTTSQARKPANQRTGESKAGELNKDNVTVLADKRINGLVVMARTEDIPTIEQIIESMDIKLSQVLIETVIVEVQLGDGINTGIDWVQNGRFQGEGSWKTQNMTGPHGLDIYNYRKGDGTETDPYVYSRFEENQAPSGWEKIGSALTENIWEAGKLTKNTYWTGNAGFAQMMSGGANNGSQASALLNAANAASNVVGSALNYVFKSDKLNLSAIIQATKTDNRAKYLASPIVMTLDNKEATIDATESRKFFSGYETSSSYSTYMRTPKYDSKDIGIQIKVTPKINPNGTVMLSIEEEYSQVIEGGQSILVGDGAGKELIDTSLSRKMSADALLENMQTVILCGLTETSKSESETGIPILKDIPLIGKWLFGSVRQNENRKELLVFMTPYVLDDAQAAQAEALRRKKTLSDPRPWDDHGWSLSPIADPVSKQEQMRRIKDEWRIQDEERRTKIAIEKAKVDRVKQLEKMSKDERELWLKMHKKELDDEAQDELEEKMLDEKSQEELKKLAAEIREKKLGAAEKALKQADEEASAENERGKLDAAKKAKEEK